MAINSDLQIIRNHSETSKKEAEDIYNLDIEINESLSKQNPKENTTATLGNCGRTYTCQTCAYCKRI